VSFQTRSLLLSLALTGCAVGPDYRRPAAESPPAFRELPGEWKQAQPRDEIARGKWWEIFGDAQLNRLVEQIDVSNQTLRNAEAQYRQAQAATAIARAAFFPTLEFDASVTRNRSPAGLSGGLTAGQILTQRSGAFNASWAPDFWGAVRRSVESARASEQASAATLASARLLLQSQLATSYFQLRVLDVQRVLLEDTVAAYQKSLDLTQNRYQAGVAARVDVVQAETQLKSTQAQMLDLGVQRAQLEHAIAMLIGKAPGEFTIAPVPKFVAAMPPIPTGLPSELLERRPDVASAERSAAAANAQIGVAKAAFFPAVTLTGSLGSRTLAASQWFTAPSRFWSVGPALAQTVFDAGLRRAKTEQAIAAYDASVATYRQAVLTAFQQVEDSLAAIRILEEEANVQDDAVQAARQSVELTVNQYKAGTVSYLNVVTVQATQLANERTAVGLLGLRLSASVALVQALGGGWKAAD